MNVKIIKQVKTLLSALPIFLLFSCATVKENQVFICQSEYAEKYHYSQTCYGLNNCKHEIVPVTKEEAEKKGFTICEWEKIE